MSRPPVAALVTFTAALTLSACGDPSGPRARAEVVEGRAPRPRGASAQGASTATRRASVSAPITAATSPAPLAAAHDPAVDALRATIEGAGPEGERRAAIDRYDGEAAPLLRTLGADRDPVVRRWAALALERAARPALAPALAQAAASEPDAVVRHVLERTLRHLDAR